MMWERRSRTLFWSSLILSGFIIVQMLSYTAQMMFGWSSNFNLFQICMTWLQATGLIYLMYVLNALVVTTLGYGIWLAAKQGYWARRSWRSMRSAQDRTLTEQMLKQFKLAEGELIVTTHAGLIALTMGFLRPRIVLSAGMMRLLDDAELEAVVLHERFHQLKRHPLRSFVTLWLSKVLWYVPILAWCHRYNHMFQEVLADRYAIRVKGEESSLGSALIKLVRQGGATLPFAYSAFADTSVNFRIQHMIDPQAEPPFHFPWELMIRSAAVIMGLSVLFDLLSR
ncbi:M56 family metallopeptidase [Paenibacillus chartarius]|uniref:M56 family metallopeptidase n=1 Tax=Paenibacillus chartarius TaxID=747481 RepID=A0ABV6DFW8_9BACL